MAYIFGGCVIGLVALFVWALCRISKQSDLDRPVYPQRLALVQKAQNEIAFQAKYGRQR